MQVKKGTVRQNIRSAMMQLLAQSRYLDASMPKIAKLAGVSTANIYRYYPSKFELFYDVLEPWLSAQFDQFESRLASVSDPKERLRMTLRFMWIDLPKVENCFLINLIEALSSKKEKDQYSRELLLTLEKRVETILATCLPGNSTRPSQLADAAHLIFMAHDGFVLNVQLADDHQRIERLIEWATDFLASQLENMS